MKNTFIIFEKEIIKQNDIFNITITETSYRDGRNKKHLDHKTYIISKNNEQILFTSLHQTFHKYLKDLGLNY